MEAKATLEKRVVTIKYNDGTHNLNYYKTMTNVIDKDCQYGRTNYVYDTIKREIKFQLIIVH